MAYLSQNMSISLENRSYIIMGLLFIHGSFSTIYVDSAYHQAFNQAMALFIVLSHNKILKYYYHVAIGGLLLGIMSLYFGAGFSYVAEYAGNPLSNYIHGNIIYTALSCYAYYFIVQKNSMKFSEINSLATIGLKSKFFMHEMKNLEKSKTKEKISDILKCINLIVGENIDKTNLNIGEILRDELDKVNGACEISGIKLESSIEGFNTSIDLQSLKIILKNLIINAIEHVESFEENKQISVNFRNGILEIKNSCTLEFDINSIIKNRQSLKMSPLNKGIGLSIILELCKQNRIKCEFIKEKNYFLVKVLF